MDTTKDKDASLTTSTELVVYTSPNVQPSNQPLLGVTLESAWFDGVESTRSKLNLVDPDDVSQELQKYTKLMQELEKKRVQISHIENKAFGLQDTAGGVLGLSPPLEHGFP